MIQPPAIPPVMPAATNECPSRKDQSSSTECDRRAINVVLELERLCREQPDLRKSAKYRDAIALLGETLAQ